MAPAQLKSRTPVGKITPPRGGGFDLPWTMGVRHSSFLTAKLHPSEMHRRGPREEREGSSASWYHVSPQNTGMAELRGFIWLSLGWYRQSNLLRRGSSPCSALVMMKSPHTKATYCALRRGEWGWLFPYLVLAR